MLNILWVGYVIVAQRIRYFDKYFFPVNKARIYDITNVNARYPERDLLTEA